MLAVGMAGGVTVAAGTGVLKAPFGSDEPNPGASVSAAVTPPDRPLMSPSPSDAVQGGSTPDGAPSGTSTGGAGDSGRTGAGDDTAPKPGPRDKGDGSGDSRKKIASACRDLREGKRLDADRRRALRDAAGGSQVWTYCKDVLTGVAGRSTERNDEDADQGEREGRARKHDSKQERAERKAEKRAERRGDDDDDADRSRSTRSLKPLRPAVSQAVEISGPRV
ncbi:hypothetical protein KEF29_38975 [Streptomyces tuirus]|uniref:Uncharacterized protein n=1 Tax=Streptomyces tuirus TaxID=68278 RepID=A0A941FET1_9ACTN|nr:hypothetical protein [Streptomyces tuirus]